MTRAPALAPVATGEMLWALVEAQVRRALAQGLDSAGVLQCVRLIHYGALLASSAKVGVQNQRSALAAGEVCRKRAPYLCKRLQDLPTPCVGRSAQRIAQRVRGMEMPKQTRTIIAESLFGQQESRLSRGAAFLNLFF